MKKMLLSILLVAAALLLSQPLVMAQNQNPLVIVLKANGDVSPSMRDTISRGLKMAADQQAGLMIIELNTPGGYISAMTDIVQEIRASTVPVAVFVTPQGGWAASAGALITMAGHVAAMSPQTVIGAASPIGAEGQDLDPTLKNKEMQVLEAMARSMTEWRGPAAVALAEDTIQNARAVSAEEAKTAGLIDFIALDRADLLKQLDGRTVHLASGTTLVLHTANATIQEVFPTFGEAMLDFLIRTDTVFLLLALGLLAILIEITTPGGWVAGFVGVCSLALAVYGLGYLTVNWLGGIFLLLAFTLFILDIKAPTHGALTLVGIGSFILGSLVLFNSPGVPEFQRVSVPLVITVGLIMGVVFGTILAIAIKAQKLPVSTGVRTLLGATGVAKVWINPLGQVQVNSELWSAELDENEKPILPGEEVQVTRVKGLRLIVRKKIS